MRSREKRPLKPLNETQIRLLKEMDDNRHFPPRAIQWAWYHMPKRYLDGDGEWRQTHPQERFKFLRKYREEYYAFLKAHGMKKGVYDTYISGWEPEERTTW